MAWQGQSTSDILVASDTVSTIATVPVRAGAERLWFSLELTADNPLSDFCVDVQPHATAAWTTVASDSADFSTNIQNPILGVGGNPVNLAASGTSLIWMDVKGLANVRFRCMASDASDANVNYYWQQR